MESDLHVCGACKGQFRSYKLLECNPLAVLGPRLVGAHLYFEGPDLAFATIAQPNPGSDW